MHDIDRTQRELEMEGHELEHEHEHEHEHEFENEHEHEAEAFLGSLFGEAEHEHEQENEHEHEAESPLSESQEMELASELLEVSSEAELEYFFGKLVRAAGRGIKNFAGSATGKMVGGMLKGIAKKALPIAGTAIGGYFGGPMGAKVGGGLGNLASNLFELELEGLSHEDREFEVARQVVRLGAAAVNRASRMSRVPPRTAARRAFTSAARVYAPGLLRRGAPCTTCAGRRPGRRGHARHPGQRGAVAPSTGRRPNTNFATPTNGARNGNGSTGYASEPAYADMAPPDVDYADPPTAGQRAGRWVRRGRHVVLLGL